MTKPSESRKALRDEWQKKVFAAKYEYNKIEKKAGF